MKRPAGFGGGRAVRPRGGAGIGTQCTELFAVLEAADAAVPEAIDLDAESAPIRQCTGQQVDHAAVTVGIGVGDDHIGEVHAITLQVIDEFPAHEVGGALVRHLCRGPDACVDHVSGIVVRRASACRRPDRHR
jgi:hypothetical protein